MLVSYDESIDKSEREIPIVVDSDGNLKVPTMGFSSVDVKDYSTGVSHVEYDRFVIPNARFSAYSFHTHPMYERHDPTYYTSYAGVPELNITHCALKQGSGEYRIQFDYNSSCGTYDSYSGDNWAGIRMYPLITYNLDRPQTRMAHSDCFNYTAMVKPGEKVINSDYFVSADSLYVNDNRFYEYENIAIGEQSAFRFPVNRLNRQETHNYDANVKPYFPEFFVLFSCDKDVDTKCFRCGIEGYWTNNGGWTGDTSGKGLFLDLNVRSNSSTSATSIVTCQVTKVGAQGDVQTLNNNNRGSKLKKLGYSNGRYWYVGYIGMTGIKSGEISQISLPPVHLIGGDTELPTDRKRYYYSAGYAYYHTPHVDIVMANSGYTGQPPWTTFFPANTNLRIHQYGVNFWGGLASFNPPLEWTEDLNAKSAGWKPKVYGT